MRVIFHRVRPHYFIIVPVVAGAALLSLAVGTSNRAPRAKEAQGEVQGSDLAISPNPVDLGVVLMREPAWATCSIANTQSVSVIVKRIETSCPCIGVIGVPLQLEPSEVRSLKITYDPTIDPDFNGRLSVEITGYLHDGGVAFRAKVKLDVRDEARNAFYHQSIGVRNAESRELHAGRTTRGNEQL